MENDLIKEFFKSAIQWGPGLFIGLVILYGIYKIAIKFVSQLVKSQQEQAVAIGNLTCAIQKSITRDNTEHREMIIMLKVIAEKIEV